MTARSVARLSDVARDTGRIENIRVDQDIATLNVWLPHLTWAADTHRSDDRITCTSGLAAGKCSRLWAVVEEEVT